MQAGHALAAAADGVHVTAAGFSLVFLLPAAFVELDSADLAAAGRPSLLRIATAGAWHNAVLGLACWPVAALLARLPAGPALQALLTSLHLLLSYCVSLSAALALLNMAPVHFLDGQQALEALLLRPSKARSELPERATEEQGCGGDEPGSGKSSGRSGRARVVRWILHGGSCLYGSVVLLHLWRMY
jgi:S2P endopeptidase